MKTHDLTQVSQSRNPRPSNPLERAGDTRPRPGKDPSLWSEALTSILATLVLGVMVSGLYPLVGWGLGQGLFHHKANGSLIVAADGKTVLGSELLGQNFGGKQYFNPRPSAPRAAGYDTPARGGPHRGPTRDTRLNGQHKKDATGTPVNDPSNYDGIKDLVAAYRSANGLKETDAVPADAVTRSGSGLDPHISVANAQLQLARVARERGQSPEEIRRLVDRYTEGRDLGLFGEPRVNTLLLNLALDGRLPNGAGR